MCCVIGPLGFIESARQINDLMSGLVGLLLSIKHPTCPEQASVSKINIPSFFCIVYTTGNDSGLGIIYSLSSSENRSLDRPPSASWSTTSPNLQTLVQKIEINYKNPGNTEIRSKFLVFVSFLCRRLSVWKSRANPDL